MAQTTEKFGKYILLDKVATGGMAELFRARLTGAGGFEKLIAIKRILQHFNDEDKLVSSFIDEAKLAAFLHHPNIVQIYDFGYQDDVYYIAMEYLAGKDLRYTLKKALRTEKTMPIEVMLYVVTRLCEGLEYAHTLKDFSGNPLNIIHRDIGPQNLFITYDGQVKIIDFGIAKAATHNTNTQAGTIKGKVAYMSPEHASGETVDYRSDIFSVGIVLYELLSGEKMYKGDTFEALAQARKADFKPLKTLKPDLPERLNAIVEKALAKDVEQRYQSAHLLCNDLETFMREESLQASSRDLAAYMNALFSEESKTEECRISEYLMAKSDSDEADETDVSKTVISDEVPVGEFDKTISMGKPIRTTGQIIGVLILLAIVVTAGYAGFLYFKKPAVFNRITKIVQVEDIDFYRRLIQEKGLAEAETRLEAAVKNNPENIELAKLYGSLLGEAGVGLLESDRAAALQKLEAAIVYNPDLYDAAMALGKAYTADKKHRRAIDYYQAAARIKPRNPDIFFNLGYHYAVLNDYGKAREMYKEVIRLSPPFIDEAWFNLALINEKTDNTDKAVENLKNALKANPDNKNARLFLENLTR